MNDPAFRPAKILPPLTETGSLETTCIYSATGRLPSDEPLLTRRPFRPPHTRSLTRAW